MLNSKLMQSEEIMGGLKEIDEKVITTKQIDEEWNYLETEYDAGQAAYKESLFAIGNGYVGIRGYFDEGYPQPVQYSSPSVFLNGVYESDPIHYDEVAYGFAQNCHRILDVPHFSFLFKLDGVQFTLSSGKVLEYQRWLDLQSGRLCREIIWRAPSGKEVLLRFERFASNANKHLVVGKLAVTAINFSGEVEVEVVLNSGVEEVAHDHTDPRRGSQVSDLNLLKQSLQRHQQGLQYSYHTAHSGIQVAVNLLPRCKFASTQNIRNNSLIEHYKFKVEEGQTEIVDALVAYADSRTAGCDPMQRTLDVCAKYSDMPYQALLDQQKILINDFWDSADIQVEADSKTQFSIRFAFYHLYQSTGRDGMSSIAAKGLTGSGYDGHYFWDSEIYVFPFWLFSKPEYAKSLLQYRINILSSARNRANQIGHDKGALYAWRTIGGEECSSYFPAGTAQYHINADIAYAARSYIKVTEDYEFLCNGLAEVVLETVRIWMDIGCISERHDNQFCIYEVTGPDEYTALVNNNFYTNKLAQSHLYWAYEVAAIMAERYPSVWQQLTHQLELDQNEIDSWKHAADNMYFHFDKELEIYAQDDVFLERPKWDFENIADDKYPLLLHFHPLVIYRYQVLKQPDVLLALLLEGEQESIDVKKKSYEYYEAITTHDSTLSTCIHGTLASEIDMPEQAYEYFMETLSLDLDNKHNNTDCGIHAAAMGGVWMGLIQGFVGLRYAHGELSFKPKLPEEWNSISFKLSYRGGVLKTTINSDKAIYEYHGQSPLELRHYGEHIQLEDGDKTAMEIQ